MDARLRRSSQRGHRRRDLATGTASGNGSGPMRTVILVDDDQAIADLYRLGLELSGFSVVVAPDSPALFRALDDHVPDLIVLDWQLPGMQGDEVLQQVRLDPRTRPVPVLMLSNFPPPEDGAVDRVFMAGALGWLEKSKTTPDRLAQKLIEVLGVNRSIA